MSDNSNIHRIQFTDADGEQWIAEQMLGITIEGMGFPPRSHVRFINVRNGAELSGHVLGGNAASEEELISALAEALRFRKIRGEPESQ